MELRWIIDGGNPAVIVFALGWAADHRIVEHIRPAGYDVLALFNYREDIGSHVGITEILSKYSCRYIFAWSFGVWAAEQLLRGVALTRAVALNGTPYPVNERYGIEPRRMAVTIRGLKAGGMEAFNRRTYGEYYDSFAPILSPRPLEQNIAELEYLASASSMDYEPSIKWDKAIVGSGDLIFPPENMTRFWGLHAEILPLPHYPFADGGLIEKEIECR